MKNNNQPKISIITPSFNQGMYIEENIVSVLNQNYSNYEHIIIDGGSSDATVDILKKYSHLIWVSEHDDGQGDALNKGFNRSTGEIIGWINSDDYYEKNILKNVAKYFEDPTVVWVIGNLTWVYEETREYIQDKSPYITHENLLKNPYIVRQPPTFFRRKALKDIFGWNKEYYMVMDFDLWIRLAKISSAKMVDDNWAYFRCHPLQKQISKPLKYKETK